MPGGQDGFGGASAMLADNKKARRSPTSKSAPKPCLRGPCRVGRRTLSAAARAMCCLDDSPPTLAAAISCSQYYWNASSSSVVDTGNTIETQTQWILWGYPMDKYELNKRTGLNPTVVFPLNRATYPSYSWRGSHGDDAADLIETMKDFLVYESTTPAALLARHPARITPAPSAHHALLGPSRRVARVSTCRRFHDH